VTIYFIAHFKHEVVELMTKSLPLETIVNVKVENTNGSRLIAAHRFVVQVQFLSTYFQHAYDHA
jgi:hypothetical protein